MIEATGIRYAQEPIIIGNATSGLIPSKYTSAIHGAYKPIPAVIRAPSIKFITIPITSLIPVRPTASPPLGKIPRNCNTNITPVINKAIAIDILITLV